MARGNKHWDNATEAAKEGPADDSDRGMLIL